MRSYRGGEAGNEGPEMAPNASRREIAMANLPGHPQATDWSNNGAYTDEPQDSASAPVKPSLPVADQGPCLYLGPNGQRCDRGAVEDGFCAIHRPGGIASKIPQPGRVAAALAA